MEQVDELYYKLASYKKKEDVFRAMAILVKDNEDLKQELEKLKNNKNNKTIEKILKYISIANKTTRDIEEIVNRFMLFFT